MSSVIPVRRMISGGERIARLLETTINGRHVANAAIVIEGEGGLSQIFLVNGLLTISGEIPAPNVAERSHDSECHCRKAEAPIEG
ncbi:hypothetical protein J5N58_22070 [Rhizobium cremeum]|nr:hypothetical protein [Rhizobium cremeum]MCJ8002374.1 hypothetical protein [Rhizobium cremeum]